MYKEKIMDKFLTVDADKCTGCRLCEQVCSVMHEGVSNPAKAGSRWSNGNRKGFTFR